jgi:hypothetical protein
MSPAQQIAEVVDFEHYRRRRLQAERAVEAVPVPTPIAFAFFWMPVMVFVPVWRCG